jgi:hypothetical protein
MQRSAQLVGRTRTGELKPVQALTNCVFLSADDFDRIFLYHESERPWLQILGQV